MELGENFLNILLTSIFLLTSEFINLKIFFLAQTIFMMIDELDVAEAYIRSVYYFVSLQDSQRRASIISFKGIRLTNTLCVIGLAFVVETLT